MGAIIYLGVFGAGSSMLVGLPRAATAGASRCTPSSRRRSRGGWLDAGLHDWSNCGGLPWHRALCAYAYWHKVC